MPDRSVLRGSGMSSQRPIRATDTIEELEAARPSLVKRARKRTVCSWGIGWRVFGSPKLGDHHDHYDVVNAEVGWDCTCYHDDHGDTRRARVCSHVLAVWLYRQGDPAVYAGEGWAVGEGRSQGGAAAVPEVEVEGPVRVAAAAPLPLSGRYEALSPADPSLSPGKFEPPPFEAYRPDQWDAAQEVVEAFEAGARVVMLDAPTGAGKTGIADLVARLLYRPAVYTCTTKSLQDQVMATFPYAHVLKGRSNYPTLSGKPNVTADDCDGTSVEADNCSWCTPMSQCPYRKAKAQAIRSQLAVLNTAYWLREANFAKAFSMGPDVKATLTPGVRRQRDGGFIVFDECDELKDALLGFVEFSLTKRRLRDMKLEPPKKGSHKPTIVKWMTEELVPSLRREAARYARLGDVESQRRARSLKSLVDDALVVANEIPEDNWIRDHSNDFVPFSYKPVQIAPYAGRYLWGHTGKTLLMSATIISPEEMAGTLGLDYEWSVVQVPMRFPVENRQIIVAPVVEMKGGEKVGKESGQWEQMAVSVGKVIERHPGERVLVHTVSYGLAKFLMERVHVSGRKKLTYSNSADREGVLARFRETVGGVLFAPSFERGIDLADDDCRVVVVAKVPFPNLGDPRVSALMHTPGGSESYSVETIRTLVQMTGRGVRHMDDWCVSYILDKQFVTNILKRHERLLPRWWRDALVQNFPVRQLV